MLAKGTRFGPYEIQDRIGSGGMGEVYRARDARLGRDVAIKVLAPSRVASPEAIARFEIEARAIAAVSHPHIVAIYDVGNDNGRLYLVEELCEGETLRERLERGPIPWRKAVEIAAAIASGAAAAHERGIVHRDLKPENVFLTEDGHVKVLDFGLARRRGPIDGEASTQGADTDAGTVMGTVGYMSPEQVRGEIADARTDIFALGSVLYEMVTGRRAFKGDTSVDTMAAIINEEPGELHDSGHTVPPELAVVIRHCIEKRAAERFQSARDLAFALRALSGSGSTAAMPASRRFVFAGLAAALLVTVAAGGWWVWSSRRAQVSMAPPELRVQRVTDSGRASQAAISPDGRHVAYVSAEAGKSTLRLRQLATGSELDLASADYIALSGYSADGNYLDYIVVPHGSFAGNVYRVPALGGQPRKVFDEMSFGVALSPDERSVAFCRMKADLSTIELIVGPSDGTGGRVLRTYKVPQRDPGQPHWSADGREILVTDLADDKSQVLVALNVGDATARRLTQRTWPMIRSSVWLADGRGFLISASELRARPQVWHISPTGEARQLTHDFLGFDDISATSDGDTIAATTFDNVATIWTGEVDARAAWRPIEQGAGRSDGFRGMDWTADGRIIYSATVAGVYQLSVMDADGSRRRQLTFGAGSTFPAVSPDGQSIAFSQNVGTRTTIHVMDLDGSNTREVGDVDAGRATWTPDGRSIIFMPRKEGRPEVRRVPAAGGPSSVISTDLFNVPKVSPDGRWLAGLTDEGQRIRVAIEPYPGGGAKRVLDIPANDTGVGWTADSRGLLVARDGNLWSYPIDGGPPAQVTRLEGEPIMFWAVAPTGRLAAVRVRQTSDIVTIAGLRALTGAK